MIPVLASLPRELFGEIVSLLLLADQAALSRTCKVLNRVLTPIVWSDIELHHRGTHEGIDIEHEINSLKYEDAEEQLERMLKADPQYPHKKSVFAPSMRKYTQGELDREEWAKGFKAKNRLARYYGNGPQEPRATDNCNRRNFQFGREEKLVGVRKSTSRERWAFLAQYVRSICLSIGVDDEVVEVISSFANLESLELIGLPLSRGHTATAPDIHLPNLQNLKLRGYFPAALVRKLCSNAKNIKHLDLGLLATPTDDTAYAETLLKDDESWAPVTDKQAERYQQKGAEAAALAISVDGEKDLGNNGSAKDQETGSDDDDDDEDDEEGQPWALHSPIWLPRSLPQQFKALTHLHLVKPFTGETRLSLAHDSFAEIPHRYEQVLNKEWVFLLEGVASTLKELILEHRVPMSVGDTVGDGDPKPETKRSMGNSIYPWQSTDPDRGDELFCRSVLKLLLDKSDQFRQLKQLSFRGIQIKGIQTRTDTDEVPGKNGVPDNDDLLGRNFPTCNIEIFEPAYPIHVYAGYVYQHWPDDRHEAMQDQGDGLLYNLSYYNDYKMRYGSQWKVQEC